MTEVLNIIESSKGKRRNSCIASSLCRGVALTNLPTRGFLLLSVSGLHAELMLHLHVHHS